MNTKIKFPDLTLAQIIALAFAGLPSLLVLLGIDLGADQSNALDNLRDLGIGLFAGDAAIRVGRNLGNKVPPGDPAADEPLAGRTRL